MRLSNADLQRLSGLLDQALDLPESEHEAWLASLQGDALALAPTLRELLAKQARHETGDLIDRLPAFLPDPDRTGPGDTVGPYRLLHEVGQGGMGAVWLAERADGTLTRKVALKLPHIGWIPGLADRFAREREILANLEHPHIARLYDAGFDQRGRPYMAIEYVEGLPIDRFCREQALGVRERLILLLQVAEAVAFAHGRLVVHRDLKPGNILVTADRQVRLLDFGIAKLLEGERAAETALTQLGGRALTLDYASPEQIRGEPIGTASDVYGLGVVAFELLAGARPYRLQRGSAAELEEAITRQELPLASTVAEDLPTRRALAGDLDAILNKALKKITAERYATVDALAADWRRWLDGEPVLARPDTAVDRLVRLARRHRRPLAAALLGGGAIVLAVGLGAAAVVIAALTVGLGAALVQTRRATTERDHALALAERNAAVNQFLEVLITRSARAGPLTAQQLLERSELLVEREIRGNAEHRAYVLGVLSNCHSHLDNPARALALLGKAVDAARGSADRSLHDSLAARQALLRGQLGEVDRAIAELDALLARAGTQTEARCEAHRARSIVAAWEGQADDALHHAQEALRCYRECRTLPPRHEAMVLGDLAWAHLMHGHGDEAESQFARAMAAFERLGLGDSPAATQLIGIWALARQELGDLPRSLELFDRALAIGERAGDDTPPSVYMLSNRAYTLTQMGRYAEAEAGYRRAAEVAASLPAPLIVYSIRMCLVELYADQGRVDHGEAELADADATCSVAVPENGPAAFSRRLAAARLALLRGRPDDAVQAYGGECDTSNRSAGTANALLGRSGAWLYGGELDRAEADARAALDIAVALQGRLPASFRSGLAWLAIARVESARGHAAAAAECARSARAQLEPTLDASHPALAEAARLAGAAAAA